MINVTVNGEAKTLSPNTNLESAISEWQSGDMKFAIAINENFIPKSNYADTLLQDGDAVELLSPMQGG